MRKSGNYVFYSFSFTLKCSNIFARLYPRFVGAVDVNPLLPYYRMHEIIRTSANIIYFVLYRKFGIIRDMEFSHT